MVRNYHREYDFSDDELREILIDRLLDYKAIVKESSEAKLSDTIVGLLEERGAKDVRFAEGLDPKLFAGFSGSATPDDRSSVFLMPWMLWSLILTSQAHKRAPFAWRVIPPMAAVL